MNGFDKNVADIQKSLDAKVLVATQSTTTSLEQARQLSSLARDEGTRLSGELQRLRALVEANSQHVTALATKVERIEEFGFEGFSASTAKLRRELESALSAFQNHLKELGYSPKTSKITVTIDDTFTSNAFYSEADNRIMLARNIADDPTIAVQTYAVHVLRSSNPKFASEQLIFGLADYLTCSVFNDPRLGRKFFKSTPLRNLDNTLEFQKMDEKTPQDGGAIWGGAFWELRSKISQATADKLLFSTWLAMHAKGGRRDENADFVQQLLDTDKKVDGGKHADQIRSVFEGRGLKVES